MGAPGKDVDGIVDAGQISVFAATATPPTLRDLSRGSAALPGEPVTQEVIGGYLSSSTTNLYVASPAKATVHRISWSSAAAGDRAPEATYTAGSDGIAFGTAVS